MDKANITLHDFLVKYSGMPSNKIAQREGKVKEELHFSYKYRCDFCIFSSKSLTESKSKTSCKLCNGTRADELC